MCAKVQKADYIDVEYDDILEDRDFISVMTQRVYNAFGVTGGTVYFRGMKKGVEYKLAGHKQELTKMSYADEDIKFTVK